MSATWATLAGTWRGGSIDPDRLLDPGNERLVEHYPVAQPDKENNPLVVPPALPDHQRFDHLWQPLHLPVDFSGPNPHTTWVERGIGTPVDNEPFHQTYSFLLIQEQS
jgi:hypothetical protein